MLGWTSFPVLSLIPHISSYKDREHPASTSFTAPRTLWGRWELPWGNPGQPGRAWGCLMPICVSSLSQGEARFLTHGKWNHNLSHFQALWWLTSYVNLTGLRNAQRAGETLFLLALFVRRTLTRRDFDTRSGSREQDFKGEFSELVLGFLELAL